MLIDKSLWFIGALMRYKTRFGDRRNDTMEGARSKGGIAAHVERNSRYLVAGKVVGKRSDTFMK